MWLNPRETADLVTFAEEILNGKLRFLCSESCSESPIFFQISRIHRFIENHSQYRDLYVITPKQGKIRNRETIRLCNPFIIPD